ncbi:cleft lip and palate transmembrane 1, partial [Nadsonia fulvescens var. elongata DSM 6958]
NGSLYAHVLTRIAPVKPLDGQSSDPNDEIGHSVISITQYLPQRRVIKTKSLLKGEDNHDTDETSNEDEDIYETTDNNREIIVSHIHPNMTLQVVDTTASINYAATAPLIKSYMQLSNKVHPLDTTAGFYHPVIFHNEFWNLKKDYMPVKDLTKIGLNLAISTTSFLKFQMVATFSDGIRQQEMSGMVPASQFDEFKRVLMETNVYLLAVTVAVSLMHTLFEFLAFKNDISHWKQKKDNVGVSVRTIMANVIMQLIILLYLIDNNEETSYMILLSQGMGIVVEAWKITKSVDIQFSPPTDANLKAKKTKTTSLLNIIWITDKHELSDTEARTQEYDSIAFRYLYMIAIPLILAYAGYALVYLKHKSWYSFIISTLVGSVYAYGFLMLVPSIYINYRLKSVAHIPRKALVYKFLNTFIDDLFAWVVKMPLLHRLATLRDDVIFFVYLYQTWLYRVDYSRVNEFGQSGEDDKNE